MKVINKYISITFLLIISSHFISKIADKYGAQRPEHHVGADDWGPMPSPDGEQIAFYSTRSSPDGLGRIFIMQSDGSKIHELQYEHTGGHDAEPHWSPDGKFIAFTCQRMVDSIHTSQIYIMRSDGSDLRMHWDNKDSMGASHFGEWFDDGTGYVFAYWKGDFNPNIYSINLDKSELRKLTDDNMSYKPYFENGEIWFTSDRNGKPQQFKMKDDGSDIQNISVKSGREFMFGSLTSTRFYFGQDGKEENSTAFYSMNHMGDDVAEVVEVPSSPAMFFNAASAEDYLVYTTPGPINYDIHKVDIKSGQVTKLIHDE